jgi:hypothetical protein
MSRPTGDQIHREITGEPCRELCIESRFEGDTILTPEQTNLLLAAAAAVLTMVAVIIASNTLTYMRGRDLELDTRNGWIEIHKAMVNLRVEREFYMARLDLTYHSPDAEQKQIESYVLAQAQLRAQLNRVNLDELVMKLADFLDANFLTSEWQKPEYVPAFDELAHKVALRARPG